ncbi:MAG: polysaccharide biosynthesis C-terminal domain-containing protein [Cellulophaga sp.]
MFTNFLKYFDLIKNKGIVLSLKVFSMGVKFFFFSIILPKELAIEDYGEISLILTSITFFLFIVGFDFYNYAHRDFINDKPQEIASKLFNQFVFSIVLFIIVCPIFYSFMYFSGLNFIFLALMLLYTEYLGQELYRLLILFSKPILANIILFFRSSLWILLLLFIYRFNGWEIDIRSILIYWLLGNFLLIGILTFYSLSILSSFKFKYKLNIGWIKKGAIVSIPFLFSTLTLKCIELSDRFIIGYFYSNLEVGIYSFYSNLANSLNVVINTAVVIMVYPKILRLIKEEKLNELKKVYKAYVIEIIIVLATFILILFFLFDNIVIWIGKPIYSGDELTFWLLIGGNIFFNLSLAPHIILYGFHKDKQLILPVVIACGVNLLLNFILIPLFGIFGAGLSTLVGFIIIYLMKTYSVLKQISPLWLK